MKLYLVFSSQVSSVDFEKINKNKDKKFEVPFLLSYYNHSKNFDKSCDSLINKKEKVEKQKTNIFVKKKKGLGLVDL